MSQTMWRGAAGLYLDRQGHRRFAGVTTPGRRRG